MNAPELWVPKLGKLVVRDVLTLANGYRDMLLGFRHDTADHEGADKNLFTYIGRMWNFKTEQDFHSSYEVTGLDYETVDAGTVVMRRFATDDDLEGFIRLWADRRLTLYEWSDRVSDERALLNEEKGRLRQLILNHFKKTTYR